MKCQIHSHKRFTGIYGVKNDCLACELGKVKEENREQQKYITKLMRMIPAGVTEEYNRRHEHANDLIILS